MKIVYVHGYGGWNLSPEAEELVQKFCKERLLPLPQCTDYADPTDRTHPALLYAFEKLGEYASVPPNSLRVYETPDDKFFLTEYDGAETVHTPSNIEWSTDPYGEYR